MRWEKNGSWGSNVSIWRNQLSSSAFLRINSTPESNVLDCD
jgi:hypothetical protein